MNAVTNFLDSGYKYFITNSSMIIKDFKSSFIPFAKQHPLFSSASVSFVTASAIDRLAYKLFRKLIHKHRPAEILAHVTTVGLIVAGA